MDDILGKMVKLLLSEIFVERILTPRSLTCSCGFRQLVGVCVGRLILNHQLIKLYLAYFFLTSSKPPQKEQRTTNKYCTKKTANRKIKNLKSYQLKKKSVGKMAHEKCQGPNGIPTEAFEHLVHPGYTIYDVQGRHISMDLVREELGNCYEIRQLMELRKTRWLEKLAKMSYKRGPRQISFSFIFESLTVACE